MDNGKTHTRLQYCRLFLLTSMTPYLNTLSSIPKSTHRAGILCTPTMQLPKASRAALQTHIKTAISSRLFIQDHINLASYSFQNSTRRKVERYYLPTTPLLVVLVGLGFCSVSSLDNGSRLPKNWNRNESNVEISFFFLCFVLFLANLVGKVMGQKPLPSCLDFNFFFFFQQILWGK